MPTFDDLFQPSLGPWFKTAVSLPSPSGRLGISVSANDFIAPVQGLASVGIAPAYGLDRLRDGVGQPAFSPGSFVVTLRIPPGVESRLTAAHATLLPSLGTSTGGARRPVVRTLALAFETKPTLAALTTQLFPDLNLGQITKLEDRARYIGLALDGSGTLISGKLPIQTLRDTGESLITGWLGTATLWAFDSEGHAIDPGAVAAWWNAIAVANPAFASATPPSPQLVDASRTVLLTHPNDAPLISTKLRARLGLTGLVGDTTCLYRAGAALSSTVAVLDPNTDWPLRVGQLPDGEYGKSATITWSASLPRDFIRVGVVDVEHLLVGIDEDTPITAPQFVPSKKVDVAPDTGGDGLLRATVDDALAAIFDVVDRSNAVLDDVWLVSPAISPEAGPIASLPPAVVALPSTLDQIDAHALVGASGQESNFRIHGQRALLVIPCGSDSVGAWVRAWPHRVDPTTGLRQRMQGGAGRVGSDNLARLVVTLPDGGRPSGADLSVDLLVVVATATGELRSRLYSDLRFPRPIRSEGPPLVDVPSGATWCVCETAKQGTGPLPANEVPAGATVVVLPIASNQPATLIQPPLASLQAATLARTLRTNDRVALCEPAYATGVGHLGSDGRPAIGKGPAPVPRLPGLQSLAARNTIDPSTRTLAPTGLERLEVAAIRTHDDPNGPNHIVERAALATAPLLAPFHELGDARFADPGAPALGDLHGTGARLRGPAAQLVAERVRDRLYGTLELASHALIPWASDTLPSGATPWVAVLESGACFLDIEPLFLAATNALGSSLEGSVNDILGALGLSLPDVIPSDAQRKSLVRALTRRLHLANEGACEAERSIAGAIARAEAFIYIETPAFSSSSKVFNALQARLAVRPGLHVLIAAAAVSALGTPRELVEVERAITRKAVTALVGLAPTRVAAFAPAAPGGRPLRLSSTSVIVDDIYAYTGTSHLSRRGLSFDASIGVAVFDDRLEGGRSREVRRFRRALIGDRLGLVDALLPDDPTELIDLVHAEQAREGDRVARVPPPTDPPPSDQDLDRLDRNGAKLNESVDVTTFLNALLGVAQSTSEIAIVAERDELGTFS